MVGRDTGQSALRLTNEETQFSGCPNHNLACSGHSISCVQTNVQEVAPIQRRVGEIECPLNGLDGMQPTQATR